MRILYIFPHPDDESFGPAALIHKHARKGHENYLLTLTRGGATRQRHKWGYSVEEMGKVRMREMEGVARVLRLKNLEILDLPDSGLAEMDPTEIEAVIRRHIEQVKPDIVVTYPVHGISGFHDHLVTHAVVKRVFCELQAEGASHPRRLAYFTLSEAQYCPDSANRSWHKLSTSPEELIDCVEIVSDQDMDAFSRALDCYVTYQDTIDLSGVKKTVGKEISLEFFQESFSPPLSDLTAELVPQQQKQ